MFKKSKTDIYLKVSGVNREPKNKEIIKFYKGKKALKKYKKTVDKNAFFTNQILEERGYHWHQIGFSKKYILVFYIRDIERFFQYRKDIIPILRPIIRDLRLDDFFTNLKD